MELEGEGRSVSKETHYSVERDLLPKHRTLRRCDFSKAPRLERPLVSPMLTGAPNNKVRGSWAHPAHTQRLTSI
jgi:hypothetical protein